MRAWESQGNAGSPLLLFAVSLLDELGQEGEDLIKASVVGGLKLLQTYLKLIQAGVDRTNVGLEFGDIFFNVLGSFVYGLIDEFESYFARKRLDSISHKPSVTRKP